MRTAPADEIAALFTGVTGVLLQVVGVLLAAVLTRTLLHRLITRSVERAATGLSQTPGGSVLRQARRAQRLRSLGGVLRSTATVAVTAVAALSVGSVFGVELAPLLAGAGVVGVALAFGAQSLVRDVISGLFLLAEDQFGVGDHIDVTTVSGVVEEVGLRITTIRDSAGAVWYLRNGELLRVGNLSQGPRRLSLDLTATAAASSRVAGICRDAAAALEACCPGVSVGHCAPPRLRAVTLEHHVHRVTLEFSGGDAEEMRAAWTTSLLDAGRRARVRLTLTPV